MALSLVSRKCGDLELLLAPDLGGAIARLSFRGVDILRPLPAGDEVIVNQSGCFPLIPYSNRIAFGAFEFKGIKHQLAMNFGDHPHSIHGNGWKCAWQVAEVTDRRLVLSLHHVAEGDAAQHWPWDYFAKQVFELDEESLTVTLSYQNLASHGVPVGLGFHPYFANANQALLQFGAEQVIINDERTLPMAIESVPSRWDYRTPRTPEAGSVDNCFIGWDGLARIEWPQQGVSAEISSMDAHNAILFAPGVEKNFVAIEPVTNINNAINELAVDENQGAMRLVAAGSTMAISMKIKVMHHE